MTMTTAWGARVRAARTIVVASALLVAACGGDGGEASPTTAQGPTTTSGPPGALPNLCELVTEDEMAEATGKEVGTHYAAQNQCIYMGTDEKTLVGSVMAYRPGFVDFDDLVNTRGTRRADDIDGHPTVFHSAFFITAALKGDKFVSAQLNSVATSGSEALDEDDVERITRELLEKALARA